MTTTHVTYLWTCQQCDAHGTGPDADRQAARHTKATGHSTQTSGRPT